MRGNVDIFGTKLAICQVSSSTANITGDLRCCPSIFCPIINCSSEVQYIEYEYIYCKELFSENKKFIKCNVFCQVIVYVHVNCLHFLISSL